jgi:hypothetical protein
MRQKIRSRDRLDPPVKGDPAPIDLSATARQIGLFETSIGWQHGFIDILVALGAALMLLPLGGSIRHKGRDRSSSARDRLRHERGAMTTPSDEAGTRRWRSRPRRKGG